MWNFAGLAPIGEDVVLNSCASHQSLPTPRASPGIEAPLLRETCWENALKLRKLISGALNTQSVSEVKIRVDK